MLPNLNPNPPRTPLDRLLLKGSRVRMYLTSFEGEVYRTYLREMRAEGIERLLSIKDEKEADRLRGEIRILERLTVLPDIIADYLKGVSNGSMKKITEETENVHK